MDGTSFISSPDGVNGVNFLVLVGDIEVDKRADRGFGGTVEAGVAAKPGVFIVLFVMEGTVLIVVDLTVLIAGVGMANPSLSTWGVSVFVSTPSDFDS